MPAYAPGTRLGNFEILAHIGAGGMGDVYKARDTRLNRVVAIKTSKSQFNERFTREARAIAALNHSNIATLYDVGPDYLVMEFVEGERVKGPLDHAEALKVALQIANAIEAAHEKGIIHRDLKPGNIMQREDGSIKVLDFGLAKALEDDPTASAAPGPDSPTLSLEQGTKLGVILGTAAYMSPEQAKGKRADRRADIFSYGVVLYELLTGKRLFTGESTGEILAAVIKEESRLDAVPRPWRGLIGRCLVKDPRQRLQSIGEARILLERGLVAEPSARSASQWSWLGWAVAALALIGAGWLYVKQHGQPSGELVLPARLQILTPDGTPPNYPQISPDGRTLAFTAAGGLWLRPMDSLEAKLIPETVAANFPFWSPDSKNLGFFQTGKLKRVAASGGPLVEIADAPDPRGGAWNKDNVILFNPSLSTGLFKVSADGGKSEVVLKPTQTATAEFMRYPSFLPDGEHFLYQHSTGNADTTGLFMGSLNGTAPVRLRPDVTNAIYTPPAHDGESGRLLFRIGEALMSQPFDLGTPQLSGEMSAVAEGVGASYTGNGAFSASSEGTLVYGPANGIEEIEQQLTWFDRSGKPSGTLGPAAILPSESERISSDGRQVAYVTQVNRRSFLNLQSASGAPPTLLAGGDRGAEYPAWAPDGTRLVFAKIGPQYDMYVKHLDGDAKEESMGVGGASMRPTDWSADEKWIAYSQISDKTGRDLWLLPVGGDRKPVVFLQTPATEERARFSPDSHWMSYQQEQAGRLEVFVQAISPSGTATGIKYRVSSEGGNNAFWRRDGKELYFTNGRQVLAVPVTLGATFQAGPAKKLFDMPPGADLATPTPDGQRFLLKLRAGGAPAVNSLNVCIQCFR